MNLHELLLYLFDKYTGVSISVCILVLLQLIEIAPIKISPWAKIRSVISNFFNYDIKQELKNVNLEIKKLDNKLNNHISESIESDIRSRRSLILRTAAAISDGKEYNEEYLAFLVTECDAYKEYCMKHNIHNGVARINMRIIYNEYKKRMEHKEV